MLDPKYIREHAQQVKENCAKRNVKVDVDRFLDLDEERLELTRAVEALRAERNTVAAAVKGATDRDALVAKGKALKDEITTKEAELAEKEGEWKSILLQIPNLTHP